MVTGTRSNITRTLQQVTSVSALLSHGHPCMSTTYTPVTLGAHKQLGAAKMKRVSRGVIDLNVSSVRCAAWTGAAGSIPIRNINNGHSVTSRPAGDVSVCAACCQQGCRRRCDVMAVELRI